MARNKSKPLCRVPSCGKPCEKHHGRPGDAEYLPACREHWAQYLDARPSDDARTALASYAPRNDGLLVPHEATVEWQNETANNAALHGIPDPFAAPRPRRAKS